LESGVEIFCTSSFLKQFLFLFSKRRFPNKVRKYLSYSKLTFLTTSYFAHNVLSNKTTFSYKIYIIYLDTDMPIGQMSIGQIYFVKKIFRHCVFGQFFRINRFSYKSSIGQNVFRTKWDSNKKFLALKFLLKKKHFLDKMSFVQKFYRTKRFSDKSFFRTKRFSDKAFFEQNVFRTKCLSNKTARRLK
jgi:hypothetical protein